MATASGSGQASHVGDKRALQWEFQTRANPVWLRLTLPAISGEVLIPVLAPIADDATQVFAHRLRKLNGEEEAHKFIPEGSRVLSATFPGSPA